MMAKNNRRHRLGLLFPIVVPLMLFCFEGRGNAQR